MIKLNKKGMTLLELLVVVLLIAGLAAMAYPAFTSAIEKGRASEAVNIVGHIAAAQKQYFEDNDAYATKFSDLSFEITVKDKTESGGTVTTPNFTYVLSGSGVTATRNGGTYTYSITGDANQDYLTCNATSDNDKKVCSTLGKGSGSTYTIK